MLETNPTYPPCIALIQPEVPRVVLDTNVVLDWLVFGDATCRILAARIVAGHWRWLSTAAMRAELCVVLPRPGLAAWNAIPAQVLSKFDRLSTLWPVAPASPLPARLRCRDADDQKFIDLAVAAGARWLLSRDRALLDLAKPALQHGVEVLTPAAWLRRFPALELHESIGYSGSPGLHAHST